MLISKKTQIINHKSVNHNLIKGKKISKVLDKTLSDYAKGCLFVEAEKENYVKVKVDKADVKKQNAFDKLKAQAEKQIAEAKKEGENLKIEAEKQLAEAKELKAEAEKQLAEAKELKAEAETEKTKAEAKK